MSDSQKAILARRARFVAAALAGLASDACGKSEAEKPPPTVDTAGPPAPPVPCLSVAPPQPEPPPRPCLSAAPPDPAPPTSVGCNPPYTVGPDGKTRWKPDCLRR